MRTISQQRLTQITGARTASEQAAVLRQLGVMLLAGFAAVVTPAEARARAGTRTHASAREL